MLIAFVSMPYLDWVRCGDVSAQCIERSRVCNHVIDCINGWDEHAINCPDDIQARKPVLKDIPPLM